MKSALDQNGITLVMVHGVGDAKRGAILADFSDALVTSEPDYIPRFQQENWFVGRFPYARLVGSGARVGGQEIKEMIEVNWADVMRPDDGKTGVIQHFIKLFFGLRNLSLGAESNPSRFARAVAHVHWFFMDVVGLWAALLTMGVMLLASVEGAGWQWAVVLGGVVLLGGGGEVAARTWLPRYRYGWIAALLFLALGIRRALEGEECFKEVVRLSAVSYAGAQAAVVAMLAVAFLCTISLGGGTRGERAARGTYLWLSFVFGSSLLVVLWLALLAVAQKFPNFESWSEAYAGGLFYNMRRAEVGVMAAQVFAFALVPLFGVIAYRSEKLRRWVRLPRTAGKAAHTMIEGMLIITPVALAVALVVILAMAAGDRPCTNAAANQDILEIYQLSALRIPALLVALLPGLRVVADIAGDVLFHIQPQNGPAEDRSGGPDRDLSTEKVTRARLKTLLLQLRARDPQTRIVVVAHSQGSVITWALLHQNPTLADMVISMGNPLSAIYSRFFCARFRGPFNLGIPWHNLFREGDFIGGDVKGSTVNHPIGPGGHTDYWKDKKVADHIGRCIATL